MKRLWVLLGLSIVLVVLAACGEAAAEPTGCVQLQDGRLVPTACPTLAVADDVPTLPPADGVTIIPPTIVRTCPTGDSPEARGCQLYLSPPPNVESQPLWCSTCHRIEGLTEGLIGPDHTHIGTKAGNRVSGMSAEDYIRNSIQDPEAYVAEGIERSTAGLMTSTIVGGLTDAQVEDLVSFLLTLK